MPEDLSGWVPKADVVRETGLSERSLERRIQAGKMRVAYRTLPARRPLPVLHPDDVAELCAEMVQRTTEEGEKQEHGIVPVRQASGLAGLVSALSQISAQPKEHPVFLGLKEASAYSGLPVSYLRRCIADGTLKAIKAAGWKIRRRDLEEL